jgi:hypothetical protein
MSAPNPYELLELTPGATTDEVRAAYRRRAALVHPDRQPSARRDWAAEQMRQLNAARDHLLDPRRRAALDAQLRRAAATTARGEAGTRAEAAAEAWRERARERRVTRQVRQAVWLTAVGFAGLVLGVMALLAPEAALALARLTWAVIAGLLALGLAVTLPVVVAIVLAFLFLSIRNS